MYPIMLSDTSLGLGLAPETTCQFRTPALERPVRNLTINIFIFLFFAENTLRHLRTPRNRLEINSSLSLLVYRCECTLYFSSPQQFFFSPLLRTDSRRNKYKFYILFLRVFFSSFNIFLAGHLLLLVRSFLFRTGFDLYHHSDALRFMQFLWALGSDLSTIQNT